MTRLAALAFTLAVLLIAVSAYIRLAQGGLGCAPWPECYALLGGTPQSFPLAALLHRASAGALGVLTLLLVAGAWRQRQNRILSAAILAITVALALLGVRSGGLLVPAVVLGNFLGGLLLAALLACWLLRSRTTAAATQPRASALALLVLAAAVIMTGIASSAFYGATECAALWQCGVPHSPLQLTWFEPLVLDAAGYVVTPDGAGTLQWLHRLLGVALTGGFALQWLMVRGSRSGAMAGLVLASAGAVIGLSAAGGGVPIGAAVSHSLAGLAVVLVLLAMVRRS